MTNVLSSLGKSLRRILRACIVAGGLAGCVVADRSACGQGMLERIRQDVRTSDTGQPAPPSDPEPSRYEDHSYSNFGCESREGCEEAFTTGVFWLGLGAVTAPFWAPHAALGDDFSVSRSFARFPYEDNSGYMNLYEGKRWSAQFSADYATEFNNLDFIGGRMLVDTASRWGVDTEMKYFQETLTRNTRDSLWLGDCNLTFRFAQNENMQWRTGVGFNWLDDPRQTDFGFNFTYGFDWFPRKPWVVSAGIDWGTLGHAGLFHFRGTVGAMFNRFEAYTGYEYYDFDRVQTNTLIGGVRIWF